MKAIVLMFLSLFIGLHSECAEVKFFYTPIPGFFNKKPNTKCDVYEKLSTIFESYYGEDLVKNNTRIHNFLIWVQKDSDKIKKQAITYDGGKSEVLYACDILKKPTDRYELLGLWLGGLYIVSQYNIEPSLMPAFIKEGGGTAYLNGVQKVAFFCEEERCKKTFLATLLIRGINLGIHEFTHALPAIFNIKIGGEYWSIESAGELATFYNETTYGLPVKIDSIEDAWAPAVRDIVHNYNVTKRNKDISLYDIYSHEYAEYALGPLIRSYLNKEQLLYSNAHGRTANMYLWGARDYFYDLAFYEGDLKGYVKNIFESNGFKLQPQALDVLVKISEEIKNKIKQDDELMKYIKGRRVDLEALPNRSREYTKNLPVNKECDQRLIKIFFDTLTSSAYNPGEAKDIPEGYF